MNTGNTKHLKHTRTQRAKQLENIACCRLVVAAPTTGRQPPLVCSHCSEATKYQWLHASGGCSHHSSAATAILRQLPFGSHCILQPPQSKDPKTLPVPLVINYAPGERIAQVGNRAGAQVSSLVLFIAQLNTKPHTCRIINPIHKVTNPKRKLHLSKS